MELLISFLIALNLINYDPKTTTTLDIQKCSVANHNILLENYGDEYARIVGTDETEEQ
jgi:hypothetical protein